MPKRGQNIYKRKDGRWEGRYIKKRDNNKIYYGYVYAKTYKEIKEKLFDIKNRIRHQKEIENTKNLSFKNIAEKWIESLKPRLKESSFVKYTNILTTHLYPKFDKVTINSITNSDIMNFNIELLNFGGTKREGLSSKTVSDILSVLKSIFIYASKNNDINIPAFDKVYLKQSSKPMRILSISEQRKLSQYLNKNKSLYGLGILICMYTGIRIGEICALKWKDISFDEHFISIEKTMQRLKTDDSETSKTKVVILNPKSACSLRKIPIPDNLYQILLEIKQPEDTFLLTGSKDKFLEPRTLQNRFKSVIKACGIKDANFHSLRHTFATRCIEIGFDVKSLSEILGHANVNITLNRYVHPSMDIKQKNMNMLSDFLAVK